MQDLNTLISLGFQKNLHGELFWRGTHKVFVAEVVNYNGPVVFVDLSKVSNEIDERPNSERKGRHYQSFIKSCCSDGSVSRALVKHDIPDATADEMEDAEKEAIIPNPIY
jgi:hypothetical protein